MLLRDEFFAAVARPPFAPAVRTDIVPRPDVRDVLELRPLAVAAAVARPPFAPAARFCATVPARPPFAPASATVMARPLDERVPVLRGEPVLRDDAPFADALLVDALFADAVPRDDVPRELVPPLREVVLRDDVLRVELLRVELLRDEVPPLVLRERDDEPPDDVPLDDRLLDEPPLDDRDDDEPDDDFVSPFAARVLLTVRAAISFARFSDRPSFFSDSFTCSYCRSRFALHDWGIGAHLLGWWLNGQRCPS